MNAFEQFLASVLNPGGRFSAGGGTQLASAGQMQAPSPALARVGAPATSDDQMLGQFPTGQAPMTAGAISAPQAAPQGAPMPQGSAAPAPASGSGGGVGDFLGNIFMPQRAQRNQTVQWLQGQGLDEGTAQLLAGNKQALQQYLLKRSQGGKPEFDFMNIDGNLVRVDKRSGTIAPMGQFGGDDEVRPMTPTERLKWGIPQTDKRPYALTPDGPKVIGEGGINVNVGPQGIGYGTPPKDHVWARKQDGSVQLDERGAPVPLPVGPALEEQRQAETAAEGKDEQQKTWNSIVNQEIGRALDIMDSANLPTTGAVGDLLSGLGGTAARDLRGLLDTVKANAGFDRLQAMRDASPTGGALGQVSEKELAFLQSTIGNLEQSQTADQLRFNLKRLQRIYQNMLEGKRAYDGLLDDPNGGADRGTTSGQPSQPSSFSSEEDVGRAIQEGRIKNGDEIVVNGQRMRVEVQQ